MNVVMKYGCVFAVSYLFAQTSLPTAAEITQADASLPNENELFDKTRKTKDYSGNALDWKGQSVNDAQQKNFDTLLTRSGVTEFLNKQGVATASSDLSKFASSLQENQEQAGMRIRDVDMDQETANIIRVQIMKDSAVPITLVIPIENAHH